MTARSKVLSGDTLRSPHVRAARKKAEMLASLLEEHLGKPVLSGRRSKPLDTLIATLLSQNTNDLNSHRAWLNLKRTFPTWGQVLKAPTKKIAKAIEVGGLKNQKARRIKRILEVVRADTGDFDLAFLRGRTNEEVIDYLTSLKGVGAKTAACVLVFSLGRDVFPVDTHIHRLCNRLGLVKTKTAEHTFSRMQPIVPVGQAYSFHVNLIRFGRKVCRAQNPLCWECPLYEYCSFPEKERIAAARSRRSRRSGRNADFIILDHLA